MDLKLDGEAQTIELRFLALAVAGVDLTETADTDWRMVVNQMRDELMKAVDLWKNGGITPAATKVMSAQSRLYGESGLREAVAKHLGKDRADEHERRLDASSRTAFVSFSIASSKRRSLFISIPSSK